jgi:transposase
MSTGKKRFWSDDEKREICGQTRVEGVSVAQVAQRYAVNANSRWLCFRSYGVKKPCFFRSK